MKYMLAIALLVASVEAATAEPKGKGKGACESIKTIVACEARRDCAWTVKGSGPAKCRGVEAAPVRR